MSFFLDAKIRNGVRMLKIAELYLECSLDGWIVRTNYEDWRRAVIGNLGRIASAAEAGLAGLPPNPYHEDDGEDDPEEVATYEDACGELRGIANICWNDTVNARQKLAILLEDNRSGEQGSMVDRAYDVLGTAEALFRLAGDRKTMHKTPVL
jgi:hypothetical protein